MAKRIPNRLKFSFVSSTMAKIEGTLICSDAAWEKIFALLMDDIDSRKAERELGSTQMAKDKHKCNHVWPDKDGQTDIDGACEKCDMTFQRYIHTERP